VASDKKVVVQGSGKNLYKVSEYNGWFHAYQIDVGFFSNSNNSIGKTRSFKDAIDLIKSHSGKEIESIE